MRSGFAGERPLLETSVRSLIALLMLSFVPIPTARTQPVQDTICEALLAPPPDSLATIYRRAIFRADCRDAREQAVLAQMTKPIPTTPAALAHLQRLADELDSDVVFHAAINGFRDTLREDETPLLLLWLAGKQAWLPRARGAVLRRESGPDGQMPLACGGEFVMESLASPVDVARAELIGRTISEVATTDTLSAAMRRGLRCFMPGLPKPPPILPANLQAKYDCANRFWLGHQSEFVSRTSGIRATHAIATLRPTR